MVRTPVTYFVTLLAASSFMTSHLLTSFIGKFYFLIFFLNLPIFHNNLERTIQGKLNAENFFFQYFKYELRYDFLKLDKFVPRTRGTPMKNKSKFKRFIVLSPFLFKINITHDCLLSKPRGKRKFGKRKFPTVQKPRKQFSDVYNVK